MMGVVEAIAIIIFVIVILVLIYYIIAANSNVLDTVKNYVPTSMDVSNQGSYNPGSEDNVSMGDKIKGTFTDYASFSTDAFSKKLNAFLDEKSEELIEDWSLVTKNDLESLEEKWNNTSQTFQRGSPP